MKQRRPLIAGNWKMHGSLVANAKLLSDLQAGLPEPGSLQCDIAVCVPSPYLGQVQSLLQGSPIAWGAQDVSSQASGAYTGEVSVSMLEDFSCAYAIVGHSERRQYHGETDDTVALKVKRLVSSGVTPIVCVGESLQERKAGETEVVVGRQLNAVLSAIDSQELGRIVVAYEPVWAIGTGMTATPEMAQRVHGFLRSLVAGVDAQVAQVLRILYGGSMKPDNAQALLAMRDIDGGLIGGAALKAADFLGIISEAKQ